MKRMPGSMAALVAALSAVGCVGTTGGDLIEFEAFAAGPEGAAAGKPYRFTSGQGFDVEIDKAMLHIGGLYLNQSVPSSVGETADCYLPGIYSLEVTTGLDVDVLSADPQKFPKDGFATSVFAPTGEVWLNGGNINKVADPTVIADVEGTARKGADSFPFVATMTIGEKRLLPPSDAAHPGSHPICKQRIVTPIEANLTPRAGGHLLVRVDPRGWFANVDFTALEEVSSSPPRYRIPDDGSDTQSNNLFNGIRASAGVYTFTWESNKP